jgi:hypothetical protein
MIEPRKFFLYNLSSAGDVESIKQSAAIQVEEKHVNYLHTMYGEEQYYSGFLLWQENIVGIANLVNVDFSEVSIDKFLNSPLSYFCR